MPNRLIREGILTSPKIAKLGWAEEVFYRRLMSVVDDYGRYYADAGMLRAACYPRQLGKVSDSDIGKWLAVVESAALVRVYPALDGERYIELLNFNQQVRAKKSKFPDPATHVHSICLADDKQEKSNDHLDVDVVVVVGGGDNAPKGTKTPPPPEKPHALFNPVFNGPAFADYVARMYARVMGCDHPRPANLVGIAIAALPDWYPPCRSIFWWGRYWRTVKADDRLMGRAALGNKPASRASFKYLVSQDCISAVRERAEWGKA
jgi:hypothetical protein